MSSLTLYKLIFIQVSCQAQKESMTIKSLYVVLKDHRNAFMKSFIDASYRSTYVDSVHELIDDDLSSSDVDVDGTENVVKVYLVDGSFRSELSKAISKLIEAKLQIDCMGFDPANTPDPTEISEKNLPNRLIADKRTVLINDIEIVMKSLHYSLFKGKIYKKVEGARYTSSFKCDVRAFLNSLVANEHFKGRLL